MSVDPERRPGAEVHPAWDGFDELQPLDRHNRELAAHVHPADWQNPVPEGRYNLVVIGGGTAGLVTAAGAAGLGAKVALVERKLLGGDCLNAGCVPSKALIRASHAAHEVRRASRFGVRVPGPPEVDFPVVMERVRRLRAGIAPHDSASRFRDLGVDVYLGQARFAGEGIVQVGDRTLGYAKAVLATGGRASGLPIPGLAEAGSLTNETVFSLTELPPRLGIIGAGPIGCELAQAFARLGSRVSLFEVASGVLPREDRDAAAIIQQQLVEDGVEVICGARELTVAAGADGKHLRAESDGAARDVAVDEILVAVGRRPNLEGLDLETVGVEHDRGGVLVDDRLRTTNRRIYAAGDVCSRFKFTHAADAQARIVIQNALFFGRAKASALTIPWATYTAPEIAHVGLYPHEAEQQGVAIDTIRIDMRDVDRAILDGDERGFLKVHVLRGRDRIVGATAVARSAGDLISAVTLAMTAKQGLGAVARSIHPYPTQAEVLKKAADAYNRTRLTPRVKKLLKWLLAWQR